MPVMMMQYLCNILNLNNGMKMCGLTKVIAKGSKVSKEMLGISKYIDRIN